jgi:hypothetical protein
LNESVGHRGVFDGTTIEQRTQWCVADKLTENIGRGGVFWPVFSGGKRFVFV